MFTVLHPITLLATALIKHFANKRQEGRIRLPPDEEETHRGQLQTPSIGREIQADWS
jgi:hypothetical protein